MYEKIWLNPNKFGGEKNDQTSKAGSAGLLFSSQQF